MSMFDGIRKGTDSTLVRVVIGGILLMFIFWGAGSSSKGDTGVVATVNGVSITSSDFTRAYRGALRQYGAGISDEQASAIAADVRNGMIKQEAMVQEAERLGFFVSDEEVKRVIIADDSFFGEDGKFDEKKYRRLLKGAGMTQAEYEDQLRRALLMNKLQELVAESLVVTDAEAFDLFKKSQTSVEVEYVRIPNTALLDEVVVSDADRDAYIAANKDKLEAQYKADYDRFYNLPRRYQLRMILVKTTQGDGQPMAEADKQAAKNRAEAILAELKGGADFAEIAKAKSEDLTAANGGGLGMRPAAQFDPAEIAAVDKAGLGVASEVIETSRGFEIVLAEKIEEAKQIPQEQAVLDMAVAQIKSERVTKIAQEYAQSLIAGWASGTLAPELLAKYALTVDATGPMVLSSPDVKKPEVRLVATNPIIWKSITEAQANTVLPQTYEMEGTTCVIRVVNRTEPSQMEFDAQKGMVKGQLLRERKEAFIEQWSDAVVQAASIEQPQAEK